MPNTPPAVTLPNAPPSCLLNKLVRVQRRVSYAYGMRVCVCTACGTRNQDPGVPDLREWICGNCGKSTLIRTDVPDPKPTRPPPPPVTALAVCAAGAAIGATVGGPAGAIIGGLVGFMAGAAYGSRRRTQQ